MTEQTPDLGPYAALAAAAAPLPVAAVAPAEPVSEAVAPVEAPALVSATPEIAAPVLAAPVTELAALSPASLALDSLTPVARIVGGPARLKSFLLTYPVEFLGVTYTVIVLSRPSAKQVGDFFERLSAKLKTDPEATERFPVYFDTAGRPVPKQVLDALDDDDAQAIYDEVGDFLPKRLQPPETTDDVSSSPPSTGADTDPTSGE